MEGVVLTGGTGTYARLDGWTTAGKTGSAQKIDPNTGRYSPTNFIASFTGFAPVNNPAVTILVSLDSPMGLHEGGQVSAPVFKRIAEQVLPYLDVPRDVPLNHEIDSGRLQKARSDGREHAGRIESDGFQRAARRSARGRRSRESAGAGEATSRSDDGCRRWRGCDGAGFWGKDDAGSDVVCASGRGSSLCPLAPILHWINRQPREHR